MKLLRLCSVFLFTGVILHAADSRPNFLFIAIDDQNDWIGCTN
ncbi:hypothetical protein [Prosthecobacter sp.]